ncbi:CHRD domain-containing protein [Granulosicoccus sp. 3-233]|uniref:CHRD domain-containing protein n=1 Tax=Granulosicoccus sp. 3-233 TaxID=3417969 RepID=UPI003D32EF17
MKSLPTIRQTAPLWKIWLSSSLLLTVAACSSDDDSDGVLLDSTTFSISADGTQEIPPTGSDATAEGEFMLQDETGLLTGSVMATGIDISAAHIHEGFAGSNGDVIITLDVDGDAISVPDSTLLTADQQTSMLAGNYYLNVHSDEFPAGEIRDQLAPSGISVLQMALSGSNEVPPVESNGSGTAYITVDDDIGSIIINVITSGLTTPEAAHIHSGFAGSNGDVLYALEQDAAEVGNFSSGEDTVLSTEELNSLQAGGTYINVHSAEVPSGELRAQVLPSGVSLLNAMLNGEQEVPPVATTAAGTGVVTLDENQSTATAFVTVSDAPTANAGHIHEGAAGVNGDVIITLNQDAEDAGLFSIVGEPVTADQIDTFLNGGMYFNVHTPTNPGGEVRGQIEP